MTIKIANYTELNREEQRLVNMIATTYTQVMGVEKWNSLTAKEQHDVIMIMVNDFNNAL